MTLPLYQDAAAGIPTDHRAGHPGLRFQRLFDGFETDWSVGAVTKKTGSRPLRDPLATQRP